MDSTIAALTITETTSSIVQAVETTELPTGKTLASAVTFSRRSSTAQ
jgi:hypothetical protein